jgi:hypothetical protein
MVRWAATPIARRREGRCDLARAAHPRVVGRHIPGSGLPSSDGGEAGSARGVLSDLIFRKNQMHLICALGSSLHTYDRRHE